MHIGQYIKDLRKEKGLTSRKLSELSGVSQPYISQLETGRNTKPSPEILQKIASSLDVDHLKLMEIAGYTNSADKVSLLNLQIAGLKETYYHKEMHLKNLSLELSRSDLDPKLRENLQTKYEEYKKEFEKLTEAISALYTWREEYMNENEHENNNFTTDVLDLSDLLADSKAKLLFEGTELNSTQREKILQIIKLTI